MATGLSFGARWPSRARRARNHACADNGELPNREACATRARRDAPRGTTAQPARTPAQPPRPRRVYARAGRPEEGQSASPRSWASTGNPPYRASQEQALQVAESWPECQGSIKLPVLAKNLRATRARRRPLHGRARLGAGAAPAGGRRQLLRRRSELSHARREETGQVAAGRRRAAVTEMCSSRRKGGGVAWAEEIGKLVLQVSPPAFGPGPGLLVLSSRRSELARSARAINYTTSSPRRRP